MTHETAGHDTCDRYFSTLTPNARAHTHIRASIPADLSSVTSVIANPDLAELRRRRSVLTNSDLDDVIAAREITALYRHYDCDGVLLYVGITTDPERRLIQHCRDSYWCWNRTGFLARIDVQWFTTRAEARSAETIAINAERPVFNQRRRFDRTSRPPRIGSYVRAYLRAHPDHPWASTP